MANGDGSMAGKTCLVTGATAGIGEVSARELARKGATVVVVGRSKERCEATRRRIVEATGNPSVEFLVGDLSARAEVHRVADEFLARHGRLDVLLNNAGAMFSRRRESADGIEMTLALNHLAYFLLTDRLLDALKASTPSRVVSVSSEAHRMPPGRIKFDDIQGRKGYSGLGAYAMSKLANLLFTLELSRRLEGTGVTANALHPGFVASNFSEGNGVTGWIFRRMASLIAISTDEGAKTSIYLSSSPEVESVSGRYFAKEREAKPTKAAKDEAAALRLWEVSEELTGIKATA